MRRIEVAVSALIFMVFCAAVVAAITLIIISFIKPGWSLKETQRVAMNTMVGFGALVVIAMGVRCSGEGGMVWTQRHPEARGTKGNRAPSG